MQVVKNMTAEIGSIISVIAALIAILTWLGIKSGASVVDWLRGRPTYDWAKVAPHIAKAKNRVLILQTWFPALEVELPRWREALREKGLDFRILLADQKLIEYRLRAREPVSSRLIQNIVEIRRFIETLGDATQSKPEVNFYSTLPFGPIYVIDETIYWGIYLAQMDSMDGPLFRTRATTRLGKDIIKSFGRAWEESSSHTGNLSVTEALARKGRDHTQEEGEISNRAAIASKQIRRIAAPVSSSLNAEGGYLCVLRHGETDLNEAEIITGGLDVGINATGRGRVRELQGSFARESWAAVYSAPTRRCIETLSELLPDPSSILIRDELRERSMGELEGFSKSSYHQSLPRYEGQDLLGSFHVSPSGGEAYCDVFYRVAAFAEGLIRSVQDGDRILLCTHDTVIRMIVLLLQNVPIAEALTLQIRNAEPQYYAPPASVAER